MIETVKASDLVRDPAVYPREHTSPQNVLDIRRALNLGRILVPPIVDKNSMIILDGYHRVEAYQKELGDDVEIEIEVEDHPDRQSMFLRSIELNVTHGQKLSPYDRVRSIKKAEDLGIERVTAFDALCMGREEGEQLVERKTSSDGTVLKRTLGNFRGRPMTTAQKSMNKKASGHAQLFHVNQLIGLFESDSIDMENPNLLERIAHLGYLIDSHQ